MTTSDLQQQQREYLSTEPRALHAVASQRSNSSIHDTASGDSDSDADVDTLSYHGNSLDGGTSTRTMNADRQKPTGTASVPPAVDWSAWQPLPVDDVYPLPPDAVAEYGDKASFDYSDNNDTPSRERLQAITEQVNDTETSKGRSYIQWLKAPTERRN